MKVRFVGDEDDDLEGASLIDADAFSQLEEPLVPEREGWVFLGWYAPEAKEPWDFETDRIGSTDLTLTARWTREAINGLYRIEDGHAILLSYALGQGDATAVALPSRWQGYPITGIADGAFDGEAITSLMLPAFVQGLTADTFTGAGELAWISMPAHSEHYASRSGILYSADGTEIVYCPVKRGLTNYTVPAGVTSIAPGAFSGMPLLSGIDFGEELAEIGYGAFQNCEKLTALELPAGLLRIGADAFLNCSGVKTIRGADSCVYIGDNAFAGTGFAVFYGEESSALARYALVNGRALNIYSITYLVDGTEMLILYAQSGSAIPEPETETGENRIPGSGWYTDPELAEAWDFENGRMPMNDLALYAETLPLFDAEAYTETAAEGDEPVTIGIRITGYHGGKNEIVIPQSIGSDEVCTLNAAAFRTGSILHLPDTLRTLDVEAFVQAGIILTATPDSITWQMLIAAEYQPPMPICSLVFETNGGTTAAAVQAEAGSVVTLPQSVRDGGTLTGWYTDAGLTVPAGEAGAEYIMPETDITLYAAWDGEAPEYDFLWIQQENTIVVSGSRHLDTVTVPATINGLPVAAIAHDAFYGDTVLTDITLPEGLTTIGSFAFHGSGLREITLPSTVDNIGEYAFASCVQLTKASLPSSLTAFSDGLFSGDKWLKQLSLNGIADIGAYALEGCSAITELTLSDSLQNIGRAAFRGMSGLTQLAIGSYSGQLPVNALDGCTKLVSITASPDNANYVCEDGVLYYSDKAGIVRYPAGKTQTTYTIDPAAMLVEEYAFTDATYLEQIILPDNLLQIGSHAFLGCDALNELDIPDTVAMIGTYAFNGTQLLICGENSEAMQYAQANRLGYKLRNAEMIAAETVTVSRETLTLLTGFSYSLTAEVSPANTTDPLEWFSMDESILRVDDGYIRPLSTGETTIYAVAGDAEAAVSVRVISCPVEIVPEIGCAFPNRPLQLSVRSITDNYTPSAVTWSCEAGAYIRPNGLLSAESTGFVTVSASTAFGSSAEKTVACLSGNQTLFLPGAMLQIEDEAFRGVTGMSGVLLPEHTSSIGDYAFADCSGLIMIYIPDSVTTISSTAFDNSPDVTILCHSGSKAKELADEYGWTSYVIAGNP